MEQVTQWFHALPTERQARLLEDNWRLAQGAFEAGALLERTACAQACTRVAGIFSAPKLVSWRTAASQCAALITLRSDPSFLSAIETLQAALAAHETLRKAAGEDTPKKPQP